MEIFAKQQDRPLRHFHKNGTSSTQINGTIIKRLGEIGMKNFINNVRAMKKNHPDLFGQFFFGITMAMLSAIQAIAILLYLCFYL